VTEARDDIPTASTQLPDGSSLELRHVPAAERGTRDMKPLDLARLLDMVRADVESSLRVRAPEARSGIVGKSPAVLALLRMIDKVAPTQATVLVTGENGTGKELVARAIHLGSPRADRPFVAANCSAFNDNLLESELFGHRRGAFTGAHADKRGLFEEADGGTFLLDEVGDMSPALQVKLLRVLQEGTFLPVGGTSTKKVDVRIIAATNKDLAAMVKQGSFREDLYYRLHVVALRTPPLRERGEDLDVLIDHFMVRLSTRLGRSKRLAPATRALLRAHRWPGNVRELQNEIERIWVLSGDDTTIAPEHLSRAIQESSGARASSIPPAPPGETPAAAVEEPEEPLQVALERVERQIIERALARQNGNRTRAAAALGVSRRNLIRKLQQLGLSNQDDGGEE
jgi:two-component system response regulator HupR/HoxA